jgi:hypothetical protein
MDKKDIYKLFAIGIAAVFMIEGIALGLMSSKGSDSPGGGAALPTFSGQASTNMTIVYYEPYIIISGSGPEIDKAKQALIDRGVATYEVQASGSSVLNLKSGKDAPLAAAEMEKANATVRASATIATSARVRVDGSDLSTVVDGTSFKMQMRPQYEEGSIVPASFSAEVQNGQLVSIGSFAFLPSVIAAQVRAELSAANQTQYVEIAWEGRADAKPIVQQQGAAYKEKSYIIIDQGATTSQLQAALAQSREFATGVQPGVVSVRNGFTDRQKAASVLGQLNFTPQFPPSLAAVNSTPEAEALVAKLQAQGIGAKLAQAKTVKLKFPDFIEKDGKRYSSAGYEVELEAEVPQNASSMLLDVEFEASGGSIARFISVKPAALPSQASLPSGNQTAALNASES